MDIFKFIEDNKKIVKSIFFILLMIPAFNELFYSTLPVSQRLKCILYSFIFLIIGFLGTYMVLGLQVIIKIASKKLLRIVCDFVLAFFVIGMIFTYLPSLHLINTIDDAMEIYGGYTVFGFIIGTYRIRLKYTID